MTEYYALKIYLYTSDDENVRLNILIVRSIDFATIIYRI